MKKRFNITGVCIADRHYMMDTREKINAVMEMIDYGEYFVINRPRQYGKTTMIFLLEDYLKKKGGYLAIKTSFEEIGDLACENEQILSRTFLGLLHDAIVWENPDSEKKTRPSSNERGGSFFEHNKKKSWRKERIRHAGKDIYAVWV